MASDEALGITFGICIIDIGPSNVRLPVTLCKRLGANSYFRTVTKAVVAYVVIADIPSAGRRQGAYLFGTLTDPRYPALSNLS